MDQDQKAATMAQMLNFISLQIDEVGEHLEIVDPKQTNNSVYWGDSGNPGPLPMYRIDKEVPAKLYPNMPKSAMSSENTSVPRITCAPSIIGCMVGYFRAEQDLLDSGRYGKDIKKQYRGGYQITTFDPELILKPSAQLVPDQGRSDEHWVVPFNEDHVEFIPRHIGKLFISRLTHVNVGGQNQPPVLEIEMWLENTEPLALGPNSVLSPGYWKIDITWASLYARDVRKAPQAVRSVISVKEEDYKVAKGFSANLLDCEAAAHTRW